MNNNTIVVKGVTNSELLQRLRKLIGKKIVMKTRVDKDIVHKIGESLRDVIELED